ncbi:MAG: hypothetical protein QG632_245, partial [Candidatus Dependentiae bacterium]|nr:hypothetical protein [Candidatus Dependentiae bacterium]
MNIQHQRLFFLLLAASLVTGVVHSIPDSAGTSAKSSTFSKVNTHLKKNRHGYAAGLGLVGALNLADLFAKGKLKKAYFKKMFDRENRGTTIRLLLASLLPLLAAGAVEVNGHGYQEDQEPSDGLIPEEPSLVSGSESVVDESEEVVNSSEAPSPVSASSSFASPPVELRKPERPVTPPVVATVSNLETQGVLLRTAPVPQVNISGALKPSNNSEVSSERPPVASSRSIVPVTVPEKNVVSNPSAMADSASAVSTIKDERRTSGSRFSWATPAPSGDESIKDRMLIGAGGPSRPASPKLPILSPEGEPAAGAGGSTLQKGDEDPRKAALASMIDAADEDPDIVFHDSNTIHFVIGNIGKQFKYYQDVCALWNDLYGGNYGMLPRELEAEQSTALHEALRGMVRRTEGNDAEAHEMAQKLSRQFSDSDLIFFILSPALKEVRAIKELETKHFESAQEKRDAVMEKRCELQRNFFAYELGYSIIDFDPLLNFFLQQLDAILASVPSTAPAAKSAAERAASVVPVEELSAPPLKTSR